MLKSLKFWQYSEQRNADVQDQGVMNQFFKLFLPAAVLVGSGVVIAYQIQMNLITGAIVTTERREIEVKAIAFANRFSAIRADLLVLASRQDLRIILDPDLGRETVEVSQSILAKEYLVLSQQKQQYDQIRLLADTGQEVLRVNFNQGQPSIVPKNQLQNQSKRYWFQDTIALKADQVFISPLDLNIDFGKITQPLKPVMRFGTPVLDAQGRKRGIVVLNYLADAFLQDIAQSNSRSSGDILLLNSEGYWLKGTQPDDEWGFMYEARRDRTFAKAFPTTWTQMRQHQSGQLHTQEGLYTYTTIYPLLDVQGAQSSTGLARAFETSQSQVDTQSYEWKLVSHVPTAVFTARSQSVRNQLLSLLAGLTSFIAIASWLLVQADTQRQQSEQESKTLEQTLQDVQHNQAQLVQTEKMASLGQLVAGVAHEINNPVTFIHGNLKHTAEYVRSLLDLIQLYQRHYPTPIAEIQAEVEAIDLPFMQEDFPKLLASMNMGADRIRQIVLSLRNFSRMDESEFKAVNLHDGLESTLLILQHRLQVVPERPAIEIIKDYDHLPLVECYAGQLNQVFMNILVNAIDALEELNVHRTYQEIQANPNQITIRTLRLDEQWVEVAIVDNGVGMSKATQEKIFNPFFTTKAVGKGTGMGMSISYKVVTERHHGKLICVSTHGQGTAFGIQLPIQQPVKLA